MGQVIPMIIPIGTKVVVLDIGEKAGVITNNKLTDSDFDEDSYVIHLESGSWASSRLENIAVIH